MECEDSRAAVIPETDCSMLVESFKTLRIRVAAVFH